jgi:rfaE bifunctional protein nucleotidyltransferase chain/domain
MILSEPELVEAVALDRAAGRRVAFANGCFDLLHVGHVRYLRAAAAEADRLIVAVNDDRSVAGLKGEGRPILPAAERAELLAALRGVDYVVVFGDANVERLLTLLKPDVHCKGTDYTAETVPERAVVAAYGGRTAIVGDPKQHATRELLARIAGTSHEALGTSHETPGTSHGAPGTSHDATGTSQDAPGTPHDAPGTSHEAPSTRHPAPSPDGTDRSR